RVPLHRQPDNRQPAAQNGSDDDDRQGALPPPTPYKRGHRADRERHSQDHPVSIVDVQLGHRLGDRRMAAKEKGGRGAGRRRPSAEGHYTFTSTCSSYRLSLRYSVDG